MADLSPVDRAGNTKLVGSDTAGGETNFIRSTGNQDIGSDDTPNTDGETVVVSVGTTAVKADTSGGAANMTDRKWVNLQPKVNGIYWGRKNTVTTTTGFKLFKDQIAFIRSGPNLDVWLIAGTAANDCVVGEDA